MTMSIPTIPSMPAGHIATVSDMNALSAACTFLLTKPMAKVRDTAGGVNFTTSGAVITYTTVDFDTDGMWSAGSPNRLTIQTPGWYKLRYMVNQNGSSSATNAAAVGVTGSNNPAGSGLSTNMLWASYSDSEPGYMSGRGLWPFYLYAGDFIRLIGIEVSAGGATTIATDQSGAAGGGSFLNLEYVSCT